MMYVCMYVQKGSSAVHYITGHVSKINGIDWSPFSESQFATCAHDCCVKVRHVTEWFLRWSWYSVSLWLSRSKSCKTCFFALAIRHSRQKRYVVGLSVCRVRSSG